MKFTHISLGLAALLCIAGPAAAGSLTATAKEPITMTATAAEPESMSVTVTGETITLTATANSRDFTATAHSRDFSTGDLNFIGPQLPATP